MIFCKLQKTKKRKHAQKTTPVHEFGPSPGCKKAMRIEIIRIKIKPKNEKHKKSREIDENNSPVTQFSAKVTFQVDFGV